MAGPQRLSESVAEQILHLIAEHELQPGDRLPGERRLVETFGVSRTVVREAIRSLVVRGLVDVRPGGGAVVKRPSTGFLSDALVQILKSSPGGITYAHLREVRRLVEPDLAALAATRHTDDEIRAMEHELEVMRRAETADDAWARADVAFHSTLARATHNPLFGIVLGSVHDLQLEVRLLAIKLPETRGKALHHHTRILEAVRAGDSAGARRAMLAHLGEAEETQRQATRAAREAPE